ncbi:CocE/NonD family hydrolase [Devosia faecipullorum]|uniref:CocE/NonD family hydrolase n=1 Tax=Devosia faecipullorum TaxID=2755039 RepID=UPI00187B14BA|nr:CocE/NonD family hydrolase [Devosia faecipullorum]MBE7732454.1 CocE/NonD family hydrolase [Devosia faecipullorum]
MSLTSLYLAWVEDLPPRLNGVRKRRGIALAMDDGVVLKTDHYAPDTPGAHPTILMRLPYGRRGFSPIAEAYAERGFHVIVQACRGTERSGGTFDPFTNERADGLRTLEWIKAQPWYDGRIGLTGPSYLGYAQWAISDALPPIAAMATKVTTSNFRPVVFPSGAFHLGLWLGWVQVIEGLRNRPLATAARMFSGDIERRTEKAAATLPLLEADKAVVGHKIPFWRHWFANAIGNDAFWTDLDHSHRLTELTPPVHFISGWYDFMLDPLLADYQHLVELGHRPYLTIGTWFHVAEELQRDNLRETLSWMRARLLGDQSGLRQNPVRIHISGCDEWHEFDRYPPGPAQPSLWHIGPAGELANTGARGTGIARYRYDPADPTPSLGGAIFAFTGAGAVDNASLEARPDVLAYTGPVLTAPLTLIGQCQVHVHARAALPHADFFVRLNQVGPNGVSTNICDGFIRVTPETARESDGSWRLTIPLHATAHCFRPGYRLRLLIASGAHPRYARNLGTGEPINTATSMLANDIEIFHAGTAITLPTYILD